VLIVKEVYLCHRINHKTKKMKKNLRNILVLAMGLMTTVSFAQDWNADSRTRVDMSGAGDEMSTDQRATVGATWGGSDWSIHGSTNVNYMLGKTMNDAGDAYVMNKATIGVYEAYASTDLMGYASLTVGRQALDYGSGAILSSNQWGANRSTWDGFNLGLNLNVADITLGYASSSEEVSDETGKSNMWLNAAKADGDWSLNLLYMSTTIHGGDAMTAMGLDLTYALMGGDLNLAGSYNASSGYSVEDGDMMSAGATYSVNESMTATANVTQYGETAFNVGSASMGGYASSGSLGYLTANDQDLSIGATYNTFGVDLGATMHMITNSENDVERDVMEVSLAYSLNDNSSLAVKYATDATGDVENTYTWLTLTVRP